RLQVEHLHPVDHLDGSAVVGSCHGSPVRRDQHDQPSDACRRRGIVSDSKPTASWATSTTSGRCSSASTSASATTAVSAATSKPVARRPAGAAIGPDIDTGPGSVEVAVPRVTPAEVDLLPSPTGP